MSGPKVICRVPTNAGFNFVLRAWKDNLSFTAIDFPWQIAVESCSNNPIYYNVGPNIANARDALPTLHESARHIFNYPDT